MPAYWLTVAERVCEKLTRTLCIIPPLNTLRVTGAVNDEPDRVPSTVENDAEARAVVAAILELAVQHDAGATTTAAAPRTPPEPPAPTAATAADPGLCREVLRDAQAQRVGRRLRRSAGLEVLRRPRQIRQRQEPQQRHGAGFQPVRGDPVGGERLSRQGINHHCAAAGEVALPDRRRRHGRILVDEIRRAVSLDAEEERGPGPVVDARDPQRSAHRGAVLLPDIVRSCLRAGAQRIRLCVERGSAEGVRGGALVSVLSPQAPSQEAARAALPRREALRGEAGKGTAASEPPRLSPAHAVRRRSAGRGKFAAAQGEQPFPHHPAVESGRLSLNRDRVGCTVGREPWRQEQLRRRITRVLRNQAEVSRQNAFELDIQRLEPPAGTTPVGGPCRGARRAGRASAARTADGPGARQEGRWCLTRGGAGSARGQCELEIERGVAARGIQREVPLHRRKAHEIGRQAVGPAARQRQAPDAVHAGRRRRHDSIAAAGHHRDTGQRCPAAHDQSREPAGRRRGVPGRGRLLTECMHLLHRHADGQQRCRAQQHCSRERRGRVGWFRERRVGGGVCARHGCGSRQHRLSGAVEYSVDRSGWARRHLRWRARGSASMCRGPARARRVISTAAPLCRRGRYVDVHFGTALAPKR